MSAARRPDRDGRTSGERPAASLLLNTFAQAAPKLTGYVLSFLSAPIILSGLGLRQFGIWALTGGLIQYSVLLDLGVGHSVPRYVAAHVNDRRLCGEYMAAAWLAVAVAGAVFALGAVLAATPVSHAVHVPVSEMLLLLLSSVTMMTLGSISDVFGAYAIGRRRMLVPNLGTTFGAVINFVASVGAIALGAGLKGYALANAGASAVSLVVFAAMVLRTEGAPPLTRPSRAAISDLLSFSVRTQMVKVAGLVNYGSDKVVIAFSVGPAAAGAYELANRAAIAVREVGIYATSAIDVELTADVREGGLERARARYGRLTAVTTAVGLPPVLLAMATAPLLFGVWLSHVPPYSSAVFVALCAAYLPAATNGVGYAVAVAAGEPGIISRVAVATAIANVALTVALAPVFGIWGILSGTVAALGIGSLAQVVAVHRRFGLRASSYLEAVLPPLGAFTVLVAPVAVLTYVVPIHGRALQAAALATAALLYLGACGVWAARAGRVPQAVLKRFPRFAGARVVSTPGT